MGELECRARLIYQQVPDMGEVKSYLLYLLYFGTKREDQKEKILVLVFNGSCRSI